MALVLCERQQNWLRVVTVVFRTIGINALALLFLLLRFFRFFSLFFKSWLFTFFAVFRTFSRTVADIVVMLIYARSHFKCSLTFRRAIGLMYLHCTSKSWRARPISARSFKIDHKALCEEDNKKNEMEYGIEESLVKKIISQDHVDIVCADNVPAGSFNSDGFRSTSENTAWRSSGRARSMVRSYCCLLRSLPQSCTTSAGRQHFRRVRSIF